MKNFALLTSLIITVLFFCGCSSDSNGSNTTTIVVPFPPINLIGNNPASAEVNISWTDNSTNETGFKIERKTGSGNYSAIGTTNADITTWTDKELVNSTSYTYRVYAYNAVGSSLTYTNEFTIIPFGVPTLTTYPITLIDTYTASSGGIIQNNGGGLIFAKGIVWSTEPIPTNSLSTKTKDGSGDLKFSSKLTFLSSNTKYYVRAYAQSNNGVGYGNEISFTTNSLHTNGNEVTDNCGTTYPTIIIGGKEWMQKNLDVCKYRNGDPIPQVTDPAQWEKLTTGAWCYYENNTANGAIYGKLYNWYAVNDSRGLAPQGWHVPSTSDWNTLINFLGGASIAGSKMKESGTSLWENPNTDATNESMFTAIPAGMRSTSYNIAEFGKKGYTSNFWSSTETSISMSDYLTLYNSGSGVIVGDNSISNKASGLSIRCIKN